MSLPDQSNEDSYTRTRAGRSAENLSSKQHQNKLINCNVSDLDFCWCQPPLNNKEEEGGSFFFKCIYIYWKLHNNIWLNWTLCRRMHWELHFVPKSSKYETSNGCKCLTDQILQGNTGKDPPPHTHGNSNKKPKMSQLQGGLSYPMIP